MKPPEIKKAVKEAYGKIAKRRESRCDVGSCCKKQDLGDLVSRAVGYTEEELGSVPEGANLGLGCGNPVAEAFLQEGEVVLDLGSGAGFDCFVAAEKVGKKGKVIGVDLTPEMIENARENAMKGSYVNVEFRLGDIERLPVADSSVDVVISNCVINLVPDKQKAFKEVFRVLKPGGRFVISDIVLLEELPDVIKNSVEAYVGCLSGAIMKDEYVEAIRGAGFREVTVVDENPFPIDCMPNDPTAKAIVEESSVSGEELAGAVDSVRSVKLRGMKPMGTA